ncbi:MAG: OmpA family protein [Actinomycetota bacterium]
MAELFEEVVGLLESRSSTRALAGQFRIDSEEAAGNGAVLGVPVFIADINRWAGDPARSVSLLKVLRTIDTAALQEPGRTIESRLYEPVGTELTELLLGDRRGQVASVISGEAGISERSANALLPPTAWAVMASIADRYGGRIDRQSLLAILTREQNDLVEDGWGPWLEATSEQTVTAGARSGGSAIGSSAPPIERDLGSVPAAPAAPADPGEGGSPYPLPMSRSARLVGESEAGPRPETDRPAPEYNRLERSTSARPAAIGASGGVTAAAARTGQIDPLDTDLATMRIEPEERSLLPVLTAVLLLLALLAGIVWWFAVRSGDTTTPTAGGTSTTGPATTEGQEDGDGIAAVPTPNAAADPVTMTLLLADPLRQSTSTAVAELRLDPPAGEVCYNFTVDGVGTPFNGFINVGPIGVQGVVLVDLGQLDGAALGCVPVGPIEMEAMLADPDGHYVQIDDPSGAFSLRSQLSETLVDGQNPADMMAAPIEYDQAAGGADALVEPGRLILRGDVADQDTFDVLAAEFNDVAGQGLEIVNQMMVVDGAPRPSGKLVMPGSSLFAISSDQLTAEGQATVDSMALILLARPTWRATIVGHTDSTGPDEFNTELSLRRADAIQAALVDAGVPAASLATNGAGSSEPVADNGTSDGRAQNRRIEFLIDRG